MASVPRTKWSTDEKLALLVAVIQHNPPIPSFYQIALPEGRNANACSKMFNNIVKDVEYITLVPVKASKAPVKQAKAIKVAKGPTKAQLKRNAAAMKDADDADGDKADDDKADPGPVKKKAATTVNRKVKKQPAKQDSDSVDNQATGITKVDAANVLASLREAVPPPGNNGRIKKDVKEEGVKEEGVKHEVDNRHNLKKNAVFDPDETEEDLELSREVRHGKYAVIDDAETEDDEEMYALQSVK